MYKSLLFNILLLLLTKVGFCIHLQVGTTQGNSITNNVDSLNREAFDVRLTNPEQTIKIATVALSLAKKLNDIDGQGEACRVIGIGQSYIGRYENALDKYLEAISYFEQNNNLRYVGKVYNNIGNLYLLNDYDKALEFYNKSLQIAKKYNSNPEIARLYVNLGIVLMKKKNYNAALEKFQASMKLLKEADDLDAIIQCMQNQGEAYNYLKQYNKAETILKEAFTKAKSLNLNVTVANIYLTLSNIYLNQNQFNTAEIALKNGFEFAKTLHNRDLENDYNYAFYQLEYKRKNYFEALHYLKQNFSQDSAYYRQSFSKRITLAADLYNQLDNRRKNERIIAQQKYIRTFFVASVIVAALLAALVFLLIANVRRAKKSNRELTHLHAEVSNQKEDLDRINHHLEDIIDARTRDLKVKNQKLSDYSLHLSHEIRGPIATLKGIVYLQQNSMIDKEECIELIHACVTHIDNDIISMSKMLNENEDFNPGRI